MSTIEENIRRFEELMDSVQKDGVSKLMNYIRNRTDFYRAPASTRFHLACEGGLLQHSLNVYDCLVAKKESPFWGPVLAEVPDESLILTALLHDLCKANFYAEGTKNQKTYDPEKVASAEEWQRKHDSQGDYIWETSGFPCRRSWRSGGIWASRNRRRITIRSGLPWRSIRSCWRCMRRIWKRRRLLR